MRYAEQYGGTSAAAFALFDSELARQGLRPNRVFSDGAALPSSFDAVRVEHTQSVTEPALNPELAAINKGYANEVKNLDTSVPSGGTKPASSSLRSDVRARATEIREKTEGGTSRFDANAEIVKTPDGTLASRKSLLKGAGKQVAEDGAATIENAKDVARDLLRRR